MSENKKLFVAVTYKLQTTENNQPTVIEEATEERPFVFISGYGLTLETFEQKLLELKKDDDFDFILRQEEAYGPHMEERIVALEREMFSINGHFDHDNVFVGATIPLQNEDGNRFIGRVLKIEDDKVTLDLNHPLSGKDLHFTGHVIEMREATDDEQQQLIKQLSGEGCGCGGCGCGDDGCGCGEDGCGGHHHDHDGCGCCC